jgi:hypothetical protein
MSTPIPSHDTVPARLLHAPYEVAPSEQIARIARLRPGFDSIEQLASLSWGGSTRAFAEQGVLPLLLGRLPPDLAPAAMATFQSVREIERGTANITAPPSPQMRERSETGVSEEPPAVPFWVRGVFRLDDGGEITRTIHSQVVAVPGAPTVERAMERLAATLRGAGTISRRGTACRSSCSA